MGRSVSLLERDMLEEADVLRGRPATEIDPFAPLTARTGRHVSNHHWGSVIGEAEDAFSLAEVEPQDIQRYQEYTSSLDSLRRRISKNMETVWRQYTCTSGDQLYSQLMPFSKTPNSSAAQEAGSSEGAEDPLQKVYAEFCLTGTTQGDTLSGPVVESALQPEDLQLFRDYARDYHRLNTDSAFCPEEFSRPAAKMVANVHLSVERYTRARSGSQLSEDSDVEGVIASPMWKEDEEDEDEDGLGSESSPMLKSSGSMHALEALVLGHSDSRAVASSSSTVPGLSVPGDINSLGVHRSSSVSSSGGKSPRSVSSDKEDSLSSNGDSRRNSLQRNRSMSTSSSVAGDTASLSSLNIEGRSGASAAAHAQSHQSLGPAVSGFSVVKTLKDRGRFPCSGFQRADEILDLRKLLEGSYLVEPVMHFSNVYLDSNDRLRRVCTLTPEGYILTSPEEPLSSCSSPTALQQAKENVIRSLNSEKNSEDSSVMLHPPYTILVNFFRSLEKESVVLTDRSVQEQVNILLQEMLKRPSEGGLYRRTHVMYRPRKRGRKMFHRTILAKLLHEDSVSHCFTGHDILKWVMRCQLLRCGTEYEAREFLKNLMSCSVFFRVDGAQEFVADWSLYKLTFEREFIVLNMNCIWEREARPAIATINSLFSRIRGICQQHMSQQRIDDRAIRASENFSDFTELCCELQRVDLHSLSESERMLFFVNAFNMLYLHASISLSEAQELDSRRPQQFECISCYAIGGLRFSLYDMKNGILRGNKPSGHSLMTPFQADDPRLDLVMRNLDVRCLFCLSGLRGSLTMHPLLKASMEWEFQNRAERFCDRNVTISTTDNELLLSNFFLEYSADFGHPSDPSNLEDVLRRLFKLVSRNNKAPLLELSVNSSNGQALNVGFTAEGPP